MGCASLAEFTQSDAPLPPPLAEKTWLRGLIGPAIFEHAVSTSWETGLKTRPGKVYVWGGAYGKSARQIQGVGDSVVQVAACDGFGAALDISGKVRGFTLRDGSECVREIPVYGKVKSLSVCEDAEEVVLLDSGGRVYTSKRDGDVFEPAKVLGGVLRGVKATELECGRGHCVVITSTGGAISWGASNSHGQLGTHEDRTEGSCSQRSPKHVILPSGVSVRKAACGDRHTIFLDSQGILYSVGDDQWAQLGASAEPWLRGHKMVSRNVKKATLLSTLAGCDIAGGGRHSVLLVKDGTVFTFGFNQWGQLGHHNYSSLGPPSPIADVNVRGVAVYAGTNHTCVVKDNGELWCIGGNEKGQLGLGTLQPSMTWKKIKISKKVIKPSFVHCMGHTCAAVVGQEAGTT